MKTRLKKSCLAILFAMLLPGIFTAFPILPSAADLSGLIEESWENAVMSHPNGTSLAQLQEHAETTMSQEADDALTVSVTGQNGVYAFTYSSKIDAAICKTHTYYADGVYSVDFSDAAQANSFLSDVYKKHSSPTVPIANCKVQDGALIYSAWSNCGTSALHFPVYYSSPNYVYEATLSMPGALEGNSATLCFGVSNISHFFRLKIFRENGNVGTQILRQTGVDSNGRPTETGHTNASIVDLIGTGDGKIDVNKFQNTTTYLVKPDADFTYRLEVKDGTAHVFIDSVPICSVPLTGNLAAAMNGGFALSTNGIELNVKSINIRPLKSEGAINRLIQESWENAVMNHPEGTSPALLQNHAENTMSPEAAEVLNVSVTDNKNGGYTFAYSSKTDTSVCKTHTFYADSDYTVDFSNSTQAEAFMEDIYIKHSSPTVPIANCKVRDGALIYSAWSNCGTSALHFPVYYSGESYVYEAVLSMPSALESISAALCFGVGDVSHYLRYNFFRENSEQGLQILRQDGVDANGRSINVGHTNAVIVDRIGTGEGKIDINKYQNTASYLVKPDAEFSYKIIVREGFVYGFIDGIQIYTVPLTEALKAPQNGGFALSTSGVQVNVKKIRISTDISKEHVKLTYDPTPSYNVDLYEPDTNIKAAPIVMQHATKTINDVSAAEKRPSAIIFDVKTENGVLYAYDGESCLGTFAALYALNCAKSNVGASVAMGDTAAANALGDFADKNKAGNLWVISNDVEMLKIVTMKSPFARGVIDFTKGMVRAPGNVSYNFDADGDGTVNAAPSGDYSKRTSPNFSYVNYSDGYQSFDWPALYDALFTLGFRTVLLPEKDVTKDVVSTLQSRLVNVFAEPLENADASYYNLIVSGVNGILSSDYTTNLSVLEGNMFNLPGQNILVRSGAIVGHRGDMGNTALYPENSVESIVSAAQSGVSFVEFDLYMTLDGEIVTTHHNTPNGFFSYPENFTGLTEEQQAENNEKKVTERYWYGDLEYLISDHDPGKQIGMKRLHEIYEAVDTEYPNLFLHHELKDYRIETINRTIAIMERYDMRRRSGLICFDPVVVEYTNSMGISSHYITAPGTANTPNRAAVTEIYNRPVNSTWIAQWDRTDAGHLEELKHFGQTLNPWPTSDAAVMDSYYVQGFQGFTTNIPHHTDGYVKKLIPEVNYDTGKVTAKVRTIADHTVGAFDESSVSVERWWITEGIFDGKTEYAVTEFEIVAVSGHPEIDNTAKTVFGTETDVVALRYEKQLNGVSYFVYSEAFSPPRRTEISISDSTATVTFRPRQQNCAVLIALYRSTSLVGFARLNIESAEEIDETVAFSEPPDTVKILYWNMENIMPLCKCSEFSLNAK